MGQPIVVVDSFTEVPFAGNPAAVCLLPHPTTDAWMQAVAREMNLSETAFLVRRDDGDLDLRWFTPTVEVDLCGHATLASAHVVGGRARYHTRSGVLTCERAESGRIEMDFPASPPVPLADAADATDAADSPDWPDWPAALGLPADRIVEVLATRDRAMVELASPGDVRACVPDRDAVVELGGFVIVTAAPGDRDGIDAVSRVFAPGVGIDEDPVTGAAHCTIGPWLAARTGRNELVGEQASARGGLVGMRVEGDRVVLQGRAVTVLEGTLRSDPPPA
jgi:PhzF family phenazine biosynthesis protein